MVQMLGALQQVSRGCDSSEGLKVVDKVRLIIVTAVEGQADPINFVGDVDGLHHLLKAADPGEEFGRQSNLLVKKLYEAALAETGFVHNSRHRLQSPPQLLNAEGDCGMALGRFSQRLQQTSFEDAELSLRSRTCEQPLT